MPQSVSDQELSRHNEIERKQPRHADDIERFPGRSTASHGTPLPPSVEKAYYRKCIELKRRINDVEDANDALRVRRARINRSILKMRLERAFLLEQLQKRMEYNSDGSERSESPPPTPQEKPLRSKRAHRKTTPSTAGGAGGTSAQLSPPENPGQSSATRAASSNHTTPDARAAGTLDFPSGTQAEIAAQAANGNIATGRNSSRSNRGELAPSSSSTSTYKQPLQYGNHDERRVSSTSTSAVFLPTSMSAASHENGTSRMGGAEYNLQSLDDSGRESTAEKDIRRSGGGHRSHYHHHHHHQHPHSHPHPHSHSHREHREHHQHYRHQPHQGQDRDQERRHHHHHHHHHHQHQDVRLSSVADANREKRRVSTDTEMGEAPNPEDDGHGSGSREVDDAGFTAVNR